MCGGMRLGIRVDVIGNYESDLEEIKSVEKV